MAPPRPILPRRHGFTLIEVALCTIIVGVGVCAMMQFFAAGTLANGQSTQLTTAVQLSSALHEATLRLPFADVLALDGQTYSPPHDGAGNAIAALGSDWAQKLTVDDVNLSDLATPTATPQPTVRVSVTITRHNAPVYTTAWIIAQPR